MTRLLCMMDSLCSDAVEVDPVPFPMLRRYNTKVGKNGYHITHLAPCSVSITAPSCKMLIVPLYTAVEIALGSSRSNTHDIFNHSNMDVSSTMVPIESRKANTSY